MFGTGLIIGLAGGLHCVLMCSPVVYALHPSRKPAGQLIYHSGRILVYGLLGLFFGILGSGFSLFGMQQVLSVSMGSLMILMTLLPALRRKFYSFSIHNPFLATFRKWQARSGRARIMLAGMLNGLLPCGLVYVGLAGAMALGDAMEGSVFMLGFGTGTLPWLSGVLISAGFLPGSFRKKAAQAAPVVAIVMGVLFILRGLALDIPYLSPMLQQVGLPAGMTMCTG